jgi:hypothetical protein
MSVSIQTAIFLTKLGNLTDIKAHITLTPILDLSQY